MVAAAYAPHFLPSESMKQTKIPHRAFWLISNFAAIQLGLVVLVGSDALAGSATWNLNPTSGDWNTATNWTPATVPNGPDDVATFGVSNTTTISLAIDNEVNALTFGAGASPYTFTIGTAAETNLNITGAGITNDSGTTQTFIAQRNLSGAVGSITFSGNASAGAGTTFINQGGLDGVFEIGRAWCRDRV